MIKKLLKVVPKIILSILMIVLINSIGDKYLFQLPFNLFSISMITILGIPGLIVLILINTFIYL